MGDNGFRKKNTCPYCGYKMDCSQMVGDDNRTPRKGDLSFCLMCAEPSEFDEGLNMIKFDLNSIKDSIERNRLKGIRNNMLAFWEQCKDEKSLKRREEVMVNEYS